MSNELISRLISTIFKNFCSNMFSETHDLYASLISISAYNLSIITFGAPYLKFGPADRLIDGLLLCRRRELIIRTTDDGANGEEEARKRRRKEGKSAPMII